MANVVHKAMARRDVAVDLIAGARRRGRRAYRKVNMDSARKIASMLPEHGDPPEIIRLFPLDCWIRCKFKRAPRLVQRPKI